VETGRRIRADARRNRERVLEAAHELFADRGLSVPLDEIARRAGVGPGTVHRHFPTKESLFAAAVVDRVERVVESARALSDAEDPGAALIDMLTRMLDEGLASHELKAALAGTDFDLRTAAPNVSGDLRRALGVLLSRAQEAGVVRPELTVHDLMSLVAGAFATLQHAGAELSPEGAARLNAVLFDGLRPHR
jgi:AcrR family transcriptional regulator